MNAYYNTWYTALSCIDTIVNLVIEINYVNMHLKGGIRNDHLFLFLKDDFGVDTAFMVWYIYGITEATISDVLIPIWIFIQLR